MSVKITDLTELTTPADADLLVIVDATDNTTKKIQKSNLAASVGAGAFQNLVLSRPSAATIDIDADHVQLVNASGAAKTVTGVNLTANLASSGANGLDTGSEANSTWYAVWVIWDGTTAASLLSVSVTLGAITLPSGYTHGKLVSFWRNDGSGNLVDAKQEMNRITNVAPITIASTLSQTSYTAQTIAAQAPIASGILSAIGLSGVGSGQIHASYSFDGTNEHAGTELFTSGAAVPSWLHMTGDDLQYKVNSGNIATLAMSAFELNI